MTVRVQGPVIAGRRLGILRCAQNDWGRTLSPYSSAMWTSESFRLRTRETLSAPIDTP
jgi:hypothetical protein